MLSRYFLLLVFRSFIHSFLLLPLFCWLLCISLLQDFFRHELFTPVHMWLEMKSPFSSIFSCSFCLFSLTRFPSFSHCLSFSLSLSLPLSLICCLFPLLVSEGAQRQCPQWRRLGRGPTPYKPSPSTTEAQASAPVLLPSLHPLLWRPSAASTETYSHTTELRQRRR